LLSYLADDDTNRLLLNSIDVKAILDAVTLEEISAAQSSEVAGAQHFGRASVRLAVAVALVRRLNALANNWQATASIATD
jgi:hypothetical protein